VTLFKGEFTESRITLNKLIGVKKICRLASMPTKLITAPPPASTQPAIERPSKNKSPSPITSGMSVRPKVFVPHQC